MFAKNRKKGSDSYLSSGFSARLPGDEDSILESVDEIEKTRRDIMLARLENLGGSANTKPSQLDEFDFTDELFEKLLSSDSEKDHSADKSEDDSSVKPENISGRQTAKSSSEIPKEVVSRESACQSDNDDFFFTIMSQIVADDIARYRRNFFA